jgi:gluconolactonase
MDEQRFTRRGLLGTAALAAAGPTLLSFPAGASPTIRRLSPALDRVIAPGTRIEVIATGISWAEGPVWLPQQKALLFSDPPANVIRRWTRRGGVSEMLRPSGAAAFDPELVREPGANGLALDGVGGLVIADSGNRALARLDLRTGRRTTLVDRYRGKRFNSPNDLHVAVDGASWFTDPPYGLAARDDSPLKELPHNGVYRWRPGSEPALIDDQLTLPNGIALAPGGRRLFVSVSDEAEPRIMVYDLDARGHPRDRRVFLDARPLASRGEPGLPDGMKIAADGTMFCSGPGGLHVLTPEGERLGLVTHGAPIANCAFGEDGRTLFLAANDRVLRLPLRIDARSA